MTDSALHNAAARRSGPLLAQGGHGATSDLSPLLDVQRKICARGEYFAF